MLFARLADQYNGLNPNFVAACNDAAIPIPLPAAGGTSSAPFDFSDDSPNVFRLMVNSPDALDFQAQIQYPFLLVSVRSAKQDPHAKRVTPCSFSGSVSVLIRVYMAWSLLDPPPHRDFDSHLDAFQEAMYATFNNPSQVWGRVPGVGSIIYNGDLDEAMREDLGTTIDKELWRRCSHYQMTVRVAPQ